MAFRQLHLLYAQRPLAEQLEVAICAECLRQSFEEKKAGGASSSNDEKPAPPGAVWTDGALSRHLAANNAPGGVNSGIEL